MSLQEYLKLEEQSEVRHEFLDGEVFEMEAATIRHQQIGANFFGTVRPLIKPHGCEVHFSGTRVATSVKGLYTYPDLVIFCGQPKMWDSAPNTLSNPKVLIEILSQGTKDYDRSSKFERYLELASLEEYIVIHQNSPRIEQRGRQVDGSWLLRYTQGTAATLRFSSLPVEIPLAAVYEGIEFDPA
jgi:Uma2 family endonuclease